eukprot:TRINITY_DN27355_c0_g2_i1.p1 TRINITY_DN27355_c0_g2~~TRINITY_DN27355_c0_g2_i1.p1  ORF type:complete len:273 (-),score=59.63 TRINITY_DN27355_c0_g2_i1:264-1082(-)
MGASNSAPPKLPPPSSQQQQPPTAMFSPCCCSSCDVGLGNEVLLPTVVPHSAALDELDGVSPPLAMPASSSRLAECPLAHKTGMMLGPGDVVSAGTGSGPPTARVLTTEERQREKARMQSMVKEFAKSAMQGEKCQILPIAESLNPSQLQSGIYSLDRELTMFRVTMQEKESSGKRVQSIPLLNVTDILKDVRQTPLAYLHSLRPPHLLSGEELQKRFVCVSYEALGGQSGPGRPSQPYYMAFLLSDQHERDRFYTCMKVLRWALDAKAAKG